MPRQLDQLPPDATSLARRVAALEREVRELRAARRLGSATAGLIRTAASGARVEISGTDQSLSVYDTDGTTLLAQIAPDASGEGGGLWTRGLQEPNNYSAFVGGGEVRLRTVDSDLVAADAIMMYDTDGLTYSDLLLSSGAVRDTDPRARVLLEAVDPGGGPPSVYVTGDGTNRCNLDVDNILTMGNFAWGSLSITPVANSPTSATVNGLSVRGSTFIALVTAVTSVPGTQVTGVACNNISSSGLTLWLTRTNTSATTVNWMVIGI
ncbi:hypothetical protein ACJ6WE_08880 [Streptomyces sp. MMS24-I31]|uniref:hypothetical protein n=1 Tax=Streptomyces sp. MMS24-I31 TaxID=3351563 RepID=UPI003896B7B7